MITETQKAKSAIERVQCQACLSIVKRKQIIQLLEVLAHTEEINGQRVVERKLLNLTADAAIIVNRYPFPFTHQFLNAAALRN